ncbi:MAG: 50S ribosomal protein L5 [Elusimicrobia bacterium]|nr:50S ribosomal protein L5 [Elusimicrobiota bacterium]MDE2312621.1 50S ribosomal protein L5 [Elusimicrobiota bacterium]
MAVSDGREVKHAAPRLKTYYQEKVVPSLMESRGLKNPFQVPRLVKIVINSGVSAARENVQILEAVRYDLAMLAGQWPQVRRASKSISNFKLRMGMPIGLRVTLRGDRMYEFLDRLISVASPRLRDFRGLDARGFDGRGNYNLGLRDQMIFPEVNVEKAVRQQGMNITIVTTAGGDDLGMELLRLMGMPFKAAAGGN